MLQFPVLDKRVTFVVGPASSSGVTIGMQLVSYFENDELPDLQVAIVTQEAQAFDLEANDVYQVWLRLRKNNTPLPLLVDAAMTVADPAAGLATRTWSPTDLDGVGVYTGEVSLRYGIPTPATGEIVFTGTATGTGNLSVTAGVVTVLVPVTLGMTANQLAAAVAQAINDDNTIPVTADVDPTDLNQVNLTSKLVGVLGNATTFFVSPGSVPSGLAASPTVATNLTGGVTPATKSRTLGQFRLTILDSVAS